MQVCLPLLQNTKPLGVLQDAPKIWRSDLKATHTMQLRRGAHSNHTL